MLPTVLLREVLGGPVVSCGSNVRRVGRMTNVEPMFTNIEPMYTNTILVADNSCTYEFANLVCLRHSHPLKTKVTSKIK